MDIDYYMGKAMKSIENKVQPGQKFEVRHLFKDVEWGGLSKGERIYFGRLFSNTVKEGLIPGVTRIQKAENNHAQYIKEKENKK